MRNSVLNIISATLIVISSIIFITMVFSSNIYISNLPISQGILILFSVVAFLGLTIACLSAILGGLALVKVIGLQNSTHQIQYVDPEIDQANKDFMDEWATSQESLDKQDKLYKEDVEKDMPEWAQTDDDKEVFSF